MTSYSNLNSEYTCMDFFKNLFLHQSTIEINKNQVIWSKHAFDELVAKNGKVCSEEIRKTLMNQHVLEYINCFDKELLLNGIGVTRDREIVINNSTKICDAI